MAAELPWAEELGAVFARMSGLLLSPATVDTALKLTSLAAETFSGSSGAGISLLSSRGERMTAAATDEVVPRADELQYELREGPWLTAWEQHQVVRVDDLRGEPRWAAWCEAALEVGLRSVLSAPLVAGGIPACARSAAGSRHCSAT